MALPAPVSLVARAEAVRHARVRPRAPRHRERRVPRLPARVRQPVLVSVGGGVGGELGVAEQPEDGREEHAVGERRGARRLSRRVVEEGRASQLGRGQPHAAAPREAVDLAVAHLPRQ
eukprot:6465389-Prymnesium_polylepis.1